MTLIRSIIYIAVMGILAHVIGEALPRRWFHPERAPFAPMKWERNGRVYNWMHIQKWKDHLPDMSRVMKDMVPKQVSHHISYEHIRRLIAETCVAEVIHAALFVLSFPIGFLLNNAVAWTVAALSALSNIPFILIQRYNRPKLMATAQRMEKRKGKQVHESTDSVL